MKKRIVTLLIAAAVAVIAITGCGGKDTAVENTQVTDVTTENTENAQEVTVSEDFVIMEETEEEEIVERNGMYLSEDTDMKSEPDENSENVESLKLGDSVTAVGDSADGWQNIETASNKSGYVKEETLQTPSERDAQLEAERLQEEAEQEKKNEEAAQQNTASNSSSENSSQNSGENNSTQQEPVPSNPDAVNPSTATSNLTDQQKEELAEGSTGGHWTVDENGNPGFVFEYHYGPFSTREEKDASYTSEERGMIVRACIMYSLGGYTEEALAEAKAAYPLVVWEFREVTTEYTNELNYAGAYIEFDEEHGYYAYYNKY